MGQKGKAELINTYYNGSLYCCMIRKGLCGFWGGITQQLGVVQSAAAFNYGAPGVQGLFNLKQSLQ